MKQLKLWGYGLIFCAFSKIKVLLFRKKGFVTNRATHSVTRLIPYHAVRGMGKRNIISLFWKNQWLPLRNLRKVGEEPLPYFLVRDETAHQ